MVMIRTSRSIRAMLALAAALALSPLAARAADAPTTACRFVKIGEVPVKFVNNQPLAELSINGQPAWFIIDTGSSNTIMFEGAARALNLHVFDASGVRFAGVGGVQTARQTTITDFKLAGEHAQDLTVFVAGGGGSPERAGLLGLDLLGRVDLEMDLAHHALRFFESNHCGTQSLAYWTTAPEVADLRHDDVVAPYTIKLLVNGRQVEATLDSGATVSVITSVAARGAGVQLVDDGTKVAYVTGIGERAVSTQIATFKTVTIGDEEIKNARLRVGDLFAADTEVQLGSHIGKSVAEMSTMLLGADFFRSHRVFLVAGQKRMYFTYSGGPVFQVVGDAVDPADNAAPPPLPSAGPGAPKP